MASRLGNSGWLYIFWAPKPLQMVTAAMILKTLTPWKDSYDQPRQRIKNQRYYIANKGPSSQGYGFSSNHVWMWELDYKESWTLLNWCFLTVLLEKTLESPLDCRVIQSVHPKGDQSQGFIGRTDVEAETPILWPPDGKSWLIWKDLDVGKDWRQEKGTTENEMVGWHHWLNRHEFVRDWHAAVHGVAKSGTQLSDFHFHFHLFSQSSSAQFSRSVVSHSLRPHGLYSTWKYRGQNTGVGSGSLLQGIFSTQGLNPGLLHCRQILYQPSYQGSP